MVLALQQLLLASLASGLIASCHADLRYSRPSHARNLLAFAPAYAPGPSASAKAEGSHFTYALGGQDWAGECGTGLEQSPINIVTSGKNYSKLEEAMLPVLEFGTGKNVVVINTGHAIQVQWEVDEASKASVSLGALVGKSNTSGPIDVAFGTGKVQGMGTDRVPVKPLQFHFHSPSEHTLNGKLSATEAHLVTTISASDLPACAPKGCLAVFGVLYDIAEDESTKSEFLAPLLKTVPQETGLANATKLPSDYRLKLSEFFPSKKDVVTYQGSLTTPPCTGNVLWTVFLDTKPISNRQMLKLEDTMGSHNEAEVHCNPISEATQVKLFDLSSTPSRYTVCEGAGQRTNNRALQPRNGRNIGIFTGGAYAT